VNQRSQRLRAGVRQVPLGLNHHPLRVLGGRYFANADLLDQFQMILVVTPIFLVPNLGVAVGAIPVRAAGVIDELLFENGGEIIVLGQLANVLAVLGRERLVGLEDEAAHLVVMRARGH
jgi:hypothetical protein